MKQLSAIGFDNAAKIQREAARNTRFVDFIDANVAPIAAIRIGVLTAGAKAHHVNGKRPGTVKFIDGATCVVHEQWQRSEEWKNTPWTAEEREAYFAHRKAESDRSHRDTAKAVAAFDEREKLAKAFVPVR